MTTATGGAAFAHASEAELARILDFYGVRWTYEPDTFPIAWNLDGDVIESFSPDFYLPDLELYIELTTLKQKLVRKKNRKLRRLRELYPGIRIKLFYARDFRMLLLKFGRLALVDELTGSTGQATPPRLLDRLTGDAALVAVPAGGSGRDATPSVSQDGEDGQDDEDREDDTVLDPPLRTGRRRRRGRRRRGSATEPASSLAPAVLAPGTPAGFEPGSQPA
ncbi:MAG TPA: hypothetical protein VFY23_00325 [Candidatus Limnocylindrales bacterium]|nr:hypothetical protein [Candidatus Limnocylindrales bacterium]